MKRKKAIQLLAMFFLCMLVFTVLSRAADGVTIARVQVTTVQNKMITHQVTGSGKVEGSVKQGVFTEAGQRVSSLAVAEGQKVAKGDLLCQLDLAVLQESVSRAEAELEKLRLSGGDLASRQEVEAQQQADTLARAQEDLQLTVEKGDIAINSAQEDLQTAINKLNSLYLRRDYYGEQGLTSDIMAQQEAVKAKRDALNSVIIQRNDDVKAAERAIEDAQKPKPADSTLETNNIELSAQEEELSRLQALLLDKGRVMVPEDGVVTEMNISIGSQTTSEALVLLTLHQGDYTLSGTIHKDFAKYVAEGDEVTLKNSAGKEISGGMVARIQEDKEDKNLRKVTVSLPADSMELGEMGEFTVVQEEGPYNTCIPLAALHEENGNKFVYVLDKSSSILGEELTARKVSVQVLAKNEQFAALGEGSMGNTEKIIVSSDREITGGSRVRLEES